MLRTKERFDTGASQVQLMAPQQATKPDQLQRKKSLLLKQLENELKSLDELDDKDFRESQDPYVNDSTLERLQMIAKQAAKLEIREIQKLCRLAMGKRILNIQLKKKKDQHNEKLLKKEKIELFFRENRIKRYDYQSLIQEKLEESTLVARAYDNGKGFVESDRRFRENYEKALLDCDYLSTIKEVNRMFYQNYTGAKKEKTVSDVMLKYVWVPIVLFICLGITIPFVSFLYEELVLMGLLGVILLVLFYSSVKAFRDKPNQNNQIEQTISDVKAYFQRINQQLQPLGIEWSCGKDFMFLQVAFTRGFPSD